MTTEPQTDEAATTASTLQPDPLLLDSEQIATLAPPETVRAALKHSNERRVTALDRSDDGLWADVEDADTEESLRTEITHGPDGALYSACNCHGDGPLTGRAGPFCVHAVAALFAYARGQHTEAQADARKLADAQQAALEERVARARAEVQVEPLSTDAETSGFGLWRARSLQSTTHFPVHYQVHIRALEQRANHCTCPDFATNELGTCKHVEAVLHRLKKHRGTIAQARPSRGYVFLDWEGVDAPSIRLHRGTETTAELSAFLREHFDATGRFRHRVPDDFMRFSDQVAEHGDLDIGEDALGFARRLAEDAARAARATEIGERIRSGGGRMPEVRARLYPYQVEGVAFLAGRGRALLADDMGLGKTLQAIAAAYWLHRHDGVEQVLVVCPASLKLQWAREIERFTDADVQVIQGPVATREVQYRRGPGFYVVNYELVMRDLSVINSELRPDLLVLDEAQRIKNWRTKIASAVKRIASRYCFVLTGTPLENRLEDLYSLLQLVDPRVLGPLWRYMVDFHITDERGKVLGYRNLSELRRRLAPVMLRRSRGLVADQLPERIVTRVDVPMSAKQLEVHDDALSTAGRLAQIMKRRPLTPSEQNRMMASLQRARMACNAAGLVEPEIDQPWLHDAPKLDELDVILEEVCRLAGLKVVIFSQWARMTELVEQRVRRLGLGAVRLHGGVPTDKRGALMDQFREDDAVQVFISTDAGGTGLNLQNAAVLINLDIPWNPAVLDQRIARVHRLGQKQRVQAILLVAPDSYEERVYALVQGKRQLFDNVVDPQASEDVVGVSKRLAEVLAEDLTAGTDTPDAARDTSGIPNHEDGGAEGTLEPVDAAHESSADEIDRSGPSADTASAQGAPLDETVRACVEGLQQRFGGRIERILAQRGGAGGAEAARSQSAGGLLVVLDRVDGSDDAALEDLSTEVPVALIDRRTLMSLDRLGSASPVSGAEPIETPVPTTDQPRDPPLLRKSRANLEAAGLLLQQGCPGPALDLLQGALLAAAAHRADRHEAPSPQQASVWLYAEALPGGLLDQRDAALLMRAIGLAQSADAVPPPLLSALAEDAAAFVDQVSISAEMGPSAASPTVVEE